MHFPFVILAMLHVQVYGFELCKQIIFIYSCCSFFWEFGLTVFFIMAQDFS